MNKFTIKKISDNSEITVLAMNIDNENNILIIENDKLDTLSLEDFKDMVLGKESGEGPTYKLETY